MFGLTVCMCFCVRVCVCVCVCTIQAQCIWLAKDKIKNAAGCEPILDDLKVDLRGGTNHLISNLQILDNSYIHTYKRIHKHIQRFEDAYCSLKEPSGLKDLAKPIRAILSWY